LEYKMANYYVDFVGLNTFIYEPVGWDGEEITENLSDGATVYASPGYTGIYSAPSEIQVSSLIKYKNTSFSHKLPTTASHFPALMLHRNGPGGFPGYKSIMIGNNPLTRKQKQNNTISVLKRPVPLIITQNNQQTQQMPQYGEQIILDEPSVVSRHRPLIWDLGYRIFQPDAFGDGNLEIIDIRIKESFNNGIYKFTNQEMNNILGIRESLLGQLEEMEPSFVNEALINYDGITSTYLGGGLDAVASPIDVFRGFTYRDTVFPREIYTFKKYTRGRTTFSFSWRDTLTNRQVTNQHPVLAEATSAYLTASVWPLDVSPDWQTRSTPLVNHMGLKYPSCIGTCGKTSSFGVLWNHYVQAAEHLSGAGLTAETVNNRISPGPMYARRHVAHKSQSVTSPTGLLGVAASDDMTFLQHRYGGEANWDAPSQANSKPFYDSYEDYAQDIRLIGKDYSIVSEFRISNFVEHYQTEPVSAPIDNFISITGGLSNYSDSTTGRFYDVYSTTDLMKSFDFILEDHEDFVEPSKLIIRCNAISKFLPYNGFYPVQRSVELAKQFYNSYSNYISFTTGSRLLGWPFGSFSFNVSASAQPLIAPLFAPGTLFNTIKAGVACDYPVYTDDVETNSPSLTLPTYHTKSLFDERIPFEALVEPHKYLADVLLSNMEVDTSASWREFAITGSTAASWDGGGDNLYAKMAHNFLAEIPNFFLQGKNFTTIASQPQQGIGTMTSGSTYAMRVSMYRSMKFPRPFVTGANGFPYRPPQDISDGIQKETITMYSRPSAFGPETGGHFEYPAATSIGSRNVPSVTGIEWDKSAGPHKIYSGHSKGLNYPFTPPYYHGRAWADITYKAPRDGKIPLAEIIAGSTVNYYRFDSEQLYPKDTVTPSNNTSTGPQAVDVMNDNAMQINASVNLFGQAKVGEFNQEVVDNQENTRWVIQTKFETPILNFKDYEDISTITSCNNPSSASIPRGMWHQFGKIPNFDEGIYLQVHDVPVSWQKAIAPGGAATYQPSASLADVLGFSSEKQKLGNLADNVIVKEGIVLVPFIEGSDGKEFFNIAEESDKAREIIEAAKAIIDGRADSVYWSQKLPNLKGEGNYPGDSVRLMVERMRDFVIPPQMDFVRYPESIKPFAMFILKFEHSFNKEDLQYMWQGLLPPSAKSHSVLRSAVACNLISEEKEILSQADIINNPKVKWLLFKVKQRASVNYYNKMYLKSGESNYWKKNVQGARQEIPENVLVANEPNRAISYNWPYDFFSFVELIKIRSQVRFSDMDIEKLQIDKSATGILTKPEEMPKTRAGINLSLSPSGKSKLLGGLTRKAITDEVGSNPDTNIYESFFGGEDE